MYTFVFSVLAETPDGTHMLQISYEHEEISEAKENVRDYLISVWGYWDIEFVNTVIQSDHPLIITNLKLPVGR